MDEPPQSRDSRIDLSAVEILALNLRYSQLDTMSVASDDSSNHQYVDAVDGGDGVALIVDDPTMSAAAAKKSQSIDIRADSAGSSHINDGDIASSNTALKSSNRVTSKSGFSGMVSTMCSFISARSMRHNEYALQHSMLEEIEGYKNSPILSSAVGEHLEEVASQIQGQAPLFGQFGLIGLRNSPLSLNEEHDWNIVSDNKIEKNLIIANMDVPWSAFICGSQGAGKSHTLSCLLENALIENDQISRLPHPLAAMVFHYDNYANTTGGQVCEAAYLCSSGIPVTVLVSPSNIWAMMDLYANLPGLPSGCPRPKVLPLYLSQDLLDISTMLKLMSIDPSADNIPLYMETVMSILREMAMEGKGAGAFSYTEFRNRLDAVTWAPGQLVPLSLRLQLLDSFLRPTQFTKTSRPAPAKENIWSFEPGTLTIVDLSDPFVNSNDACSLFSICLSLFLEDRGNCGRVIAMDEAHKVRVYRH